MKKFVAFLALLLSVVFMPQSAQAVNDDPCWQAVPGTKGALMCMDYGWVIAGHYIISPWNNAWTDWPECSAARLGKCYNRAGANYIAINDAGSTRYFVGVISTTR